METRDQKIKVTRSNTRKAKKGPGQKWAVKKKKRGRVNRKNERLEKCQWQTGKKPAGNWFPMKRQEGGGVITSKGIVKGG